MEILQKLRTMPLRYPQSLLLISLLLAPAVSADLTLSATPSVSQAISAVSSSAVLSSSTPVAPAKVKNGDPCGPNIQDNPNYPNTCNLTPSLVQEPNSYGINCTAISDVQKNPLLGILWDNCGASMTSICTKMEDSRTETGMWIFSQLANRCALGFFLPPYQGSAPRPSTARCFDIFTAMVDSCKTTTVVSNYGSINLKALPGFVPDYWTSPDHNGGQMYSANDMNATGEAVNVGYPSYVVKLMIN